VCGACRLGDHLADLLAAVFCGQVSTWKQAVRVWRISVISSLVSIVSWWVPRSLIIW